MSRAGRKRVQFNKLYQENYKAPISKTQEERPSEALLKRRTRYVGEKLATEAKAGFPLGIMLLRDLINEKQYQSALQAAGMLIFRMRVLGVQSPTPRSVRFDSFDQSRPVNELSERAIMRNKRMSEAFIHGIKQCHDWQRGYKHFQAVVLLEHDVENIPWLVPLQRRGDIAHFQRDWQAFHEILDLCVQFFYSIS